MTQPQLTIQQLEHAISVYEKRVEAKKLEVESYSLLTANIAAVGIVLTPDDASAVESMEIIRHAAVNLCAAKHTVATLDLEELELQLKVMRQARSGVVGASMVVPPFKSNQRH
jgi:hypothetical protein